MNAHESFTTRILHQTRCREVALVIALLAGLGRRQRILELGSGDGYQTRFLSYLGMVFASDCSIERLQGKAVERFTQCDAQRLPYASETFDLLFSSNVVEHIEHKSLAFAEMKRVTRQDALIVHIVPTHIWKLLSLPAYYVSLAIKGTKRILGLMHSRGRIHGPQVPADRRDQQKRPAVSYLWPQVHGTASSNWAEFSEFNPRHWQRLFERAGFVCLSRVNLLAYSPPELPYLPPNRWLADLGFPASVALVLSKPDGDARNAQMAYANLPFLEQEENH